MQLDPTKIFFGPTTQVDSRARRLILRPHVSVADVLAAVGPELRPRLEDAALELTDYCEDEPEDERLVRALIEPELPDGSADEWFEPYGQFELDELFPLVARLRVVNGLDYCVVHEVWAVHRPFYEIEDNYEFRQVDYDIAGEVHPTEAIYTLPLDCDLDDADVQRCASNGCRSKPDDLGGLVRLIAEEVKGLPNGLNRVRAGGARGSLAVLVATMWHAMMEPAARTRHVRPHCRANAFDACLNALRLGEFDEMARRVLIRNHPRHIRVVANDLPRLWTSSAWDGALGIFESRGELLAIGH